MRQKKRIVAGIAVMAVVLILLGCAPANQSQAAGKSGSSGTPITIFKSSGCGCCGVYSQYMEKQGFDVNVVDVGNLDDTKRKFNVPSKLQSCHTSEIGGYFVEGHIPTEAITKLLAEKPDIAGIALAGMPSGSPGMPGRKTGTWIVYAVNHDGSSAEFMRI